MTRLGVKFLVVGDDFCFGKERQGNFALLQQAGQALDFEVVSTQSFCLQQLRVSSTAIREALAADQLSSASAMLGAITASAVVSRMVKNSGERSAFPPPTFH